MRFSESFRIVFALRLIAIIGAESVSPVEEIDRQDRILHHRRLDRLKNEFDPRGAHRRQLLQEYEETINREGMILNPDYEKRRKSHTHNEIAVDMERRRLGQRATATDQALPAFDREEETGFWERLIKHHTGSFPVDTPSKPPRTNPPSPAPTKKMNTMTPRPTKKPTKKPSKRPTKRPTKPITPKPTPMQTTRPTRGMTLRPTFRRTPRPTLRPTQKPKPTKGPGKTPRPTFRRTPRPSLRPTQKPKPVRTDKPTIAPVKTPLPTRRRTPSPTRMTALLPSRVSEIIRSVALFDGDEFNDLNSYQSQSLEWLESSDTKGLNRERIIQRYALGCIYFATYKVETPFTVDQFGAGNVPPWQTSTNWVTDANECEWARIGCDENNYVTILDLFSNSLTGVFPPEVVYFKEKLQILDIGNNVVYSNSTLFNPYLGELTELTDLRTDRTNFQSSDGVPTEIGNMKKLGYFSCEGNLYEGPLDGAAFPSDLTALSVLDIEANEYGSTIPNEIGLLPALENFYIRASKVSGDLAFMVNMQSVFQTFVDVNPDLGGKIPPEIGGLSTLASFSASECSFTGILPPEIGNLGDTLLNMFFFNNSISGPVPEEWGSLSTLKELQLQGNNLDGVIPPSVCELTLAALSFLSADCVNCPETQCCTQCFE